MIIIEGLKKEHADKILKAAYESDKSAVYVEGRPAVSGTLLLAIAEEKGRGEWGWQVQLMSGCWGDGTLRDIVPAEFQGVIV